MIDETESTGWVQEHDDQLDPQKAELLGIALRPPALKLRTNQTDHSVQPRPESPMTARFWDKPEFSTETSVGDRVRVGQ